MADTNIIGSLFGVSPELLQQQQEEAAFKQYSRAGSDLLGTAIAQTGMFSSRAGAGLRGALGVQSPEEQINMIRQQASTQFNTATPEGMLQYAQFLNQQGDAAGAQQAVIRAQAMAKEAQAIATSRAQEQKALRETIPAAEEQANRVRLAQLVRELGPEEGAAAFRKELQEGKVKVASASATPAGRTILGVEAKKAEDLQKNITSGYTVLERLGEQRAAIEQGMIGGSFADTRTAIGTFASSIGLGDQKLVNALANSKSFKANQNALAAAIAKQLGVNPTDKDFQASLDQFAKNSDDPKASLEFIKQMQNKFGQRQKINEDMFNSYIENEGTFRNYKGPKMVQSFTPNDELSKLLEEQARRQNKTKDK